LKRLIVLFFAIILLCGCAEKKQTTPVMNDISFTAKIDYDKQKYVCDINLSDDALNLIVKEPVEIKGLTLIINKKSSVAKFMGISYNVDINSLPQGAIAKTLLQIFNDVSNKTVDLNNDNGEIKGQVDDINYSFIFAPTGLPISLSINNPNIIVEFSNVTLR
jgi:hypothetical protein